MSPATWPREDPGDDRLLWVDPTTAELRDSRMTHLPSLLSPGDSLIVNDAATLPASLRTSDGQLEIRLLARLASDAEWRAVLFGSGDWRTPTEHRPAPRRLRVGEVLELDADLRATVVRVDDESPRLVELSFDREGADLWNALYRRSSPVQYAYLSGALALWHVQNRFASRPWAVESPSAGRPLTGAALLALHRRGVRVAPITHAAGLSSTGDDALDRRLPFPERYWISPLACEAIRGSRSRGGRVVAAGTTVVRALEASALEHGSVRPGEGEARLVIGPGFRPRVVDGLLTGMHPQGTSHFALLEAFAPRALLERAMRHATQMGYLEHEFGDSCLVLPHEEPRSTPPPG